MAISSLLRLSEILLLCLTASTAVAATTVAPPASTDVLGGARAFSAAVDVIRDRAAEVETDGGKSLDSAMDAAFSAYFDLEMSIASKLNVLKSKVVEPKEEKSPKYFDNVKRLLTSVVGDDKTKTIPIEKLAQAASRLAKEAVDLSVFDNGLEGVMARADAIFFILHDVEIRVHPDLKEYQKQLTEAYKKNGTTTVSSDRRKRSYDHGYDSGWHIAHHLGFWQALADSNSASNHGDPVSKSHAIFWAINQNLDYHRKKRETVSVLPSRARKARSPGWHMGFHDGHADGFDIGYHQGAAHAAIRQAAMELNGLGHLPLYGVGRRKRSPYYGYGHSYGRHHHYGHADYHSHLDHIMSHIHPDPHGYGPLHYHSNWW